ncbi:hypothetical protein AAHB34_08750 [Paenarthrobacter ureafaciens]
MAEHRPLMAKTATWIEPVRMPLRRAASLVAAYRVDPAPESGAPQNNSQHNGHRQHQDRTGGEAEETWPGPGLEGWELVRKRRDDGAAGDHNGQPPVNDAHRQCPDERVDLRADHDQPGNRPEQGTHKQRPEETGRNAEMLGDHHARNGGDREGGGRGEVKDSADDAQGGCRGEQPHHGGLVEQVDEVAAGEECSGVQGQEQHDGGQAKNDPEVFEVQIEFFPCRRGHGS